MITKGAINLAWSSSKNIEQDYYNWFSICEKNNIKFVRIFLCSWSINALYDKKNIMLLKKVIQRAEKYGIEICLVLNNFVDFNIDTYSDINNPTYSWLNNPYSKKYKNATKFFKVMDLDYFNNIINVLQEIYSYDNIKYIEIVNEIDQIYCSNEILIKWLNKLLYKLRRIYDERYTFTCSISNYELYDYYRKKADCYIDLHFYSFPFESAIENIEYINKKSKLLYLGEYAKYSDNSYLKTDNAKIYFSSGLWGAYFCKLNFVPLHWWWQKLLINKEYMRIITLFNSITEELGEIEQIEQIRDLKYNSISKQHNDLEYKKIKSRLTTLVKHPLYIFKDYRNIKKFLTKKLHKQNEVIIRKIISNKKEVIYLECKNDIKIMSGFQYEKAINLVSGKEQKCDKYFSKGNYIIFLTGDI